MRRFCILQWRLIILLALSALWIAMFPLWSRWVISDPLNAIISLSPQGAVEKNIHIILPENYSLHLMFERKGISFEQLKSSIGAMGVCKIGEQCSNGVPVPIRWSIRNIETGAISSSGEVESIDSSGWSADHVYRHLGFIKVQPGNYSFKAEVLRPVPKLAQMRTYIAIQLQPKASTTWQIGLVFWGSIGQYLLAWPIAIYAVIMLLCRASLALQSRKASPSGSPSP